MSLTSACKASCSRCTGMTLISRRSSGKKRIASFWDDMTALDSSVEEHLVCCKTPFQISQLGPKAARLARTKSRARKRWAWRPCCSLGRMRGKRVLMFVTMGWKMWDRVLPSKAFQLMPWKSEETAACSLSIIMTRARSHSEKGAAPQTYFT